MLYELLNNYRLKNIFINHRVINFNKKIKFDKKYDKNLYLVKNNQYKQKRLRKNS